MNADLTQVAVIALLGGVLMFVGAMLFEQLHGRGRDVLRGLLYLPGMVAICAALVLFGAAVHWSVAVVVVVVLGLVFTGLVKGWFY